MNSPLTTFVVLLALVVCVRPEIFPASQTRFRLHGKVSCPLDQWWCYRVVVYERDGIKWDVIDHVGVKCVRRGDMAYDLDGVQFGGDGLFDKFYEVEVWITHNCTTDGHIEAIKRVEQPISTSETDVRLIDWYVNVLTVKGLQVFSYFL
ncbi:unnamed protein product [Caenorhabditis sp. 36 PRJEB53466]|nr:unnamed protein product [Caenorhabditis sp. 36 PRJEB53466]